MRSSPCTGSGLVIPISANRFTASAGIRIAPGSAAVLAKTGWPLSNDEI
jgi:hypothetical protein